MPIRNVVFDVGGVLLQWDPPAFIAKVAPDPARQAIIRREIFEHPEWHEFDRGAIDVARAVTQFGARAGLSPEQVTSTELAGETITARLTRAPGNDAAIGGLKVTTENGWFAARPSGTEDIYKIYAESFKGEAHLQRILDEAQVIVSAALAT